MSNNLIFGGKKMIFFTSKKQFARPPKSSPVVNKSYIDISNGQRFELKCMINQFDEFSKSNFQRIFALWSNMQCVVGALMLIRT